MLIRVLGSAAGGGFPQWNCGCSNCEGVRRGTIRASARSQESVAVSADGDAWFLLNASPEIRPQIESFSKLHPRAPRDTPIAGIVFTNGDLDHCLGLLSLRESQPLALYATPRVRAGFCQGNVLYRTLSRFDGQVTWHTLVPSSANASSAGGASAAANAPSSVSAASASAASASAASSVTESAGDAGGGEQALRLLDGAESGLCLRAFHAPGKPALHLDQSSAEPDDNIGVLITESRTGRSLAYIPAVGASSAIVADASARADVVFFDGTFWSSDELIALGASSRRAEDMAHWPIGGANGSLRFLAKLTGARRVYIHINNTNPILRDDSEERAAVHAAGVEVAFDGMEIRL